MQSLVQMTNVLLQQLESGKTLKVIPNTLKELPVFSCALTLTQTPSAALLQGTQRLGAALPSKASREGIILNPVEIKGNLKIVGGKKNPFLYERIIRMEYKQQHAGYCNLYLILNLIIFSNGCRVTKLFYILLLYFPFMDQMALFFLVN